MNAAHALLAVVDWISIGLLLTGVLLGLRSGLGRAFAFLLWLLAALWLGTHLSAQIVSWLPNTTTPDDPHAQRIAYGVVAGVVLLVPVFGRLLGGSAGKKKKDKGPPTHKPFGALLGLFNALLLLVLLLPFLLGIDAVAQGAERAYSPRWAAAFAHQMAYLYPAVHRDALEAAASGKSPTTAAESGSTTPADGSAAGK
jgi:uncharacterized membrane protein required for colicin V production